jgi:hypothetical protein
MHRAPPRSTGIDADGVAQPEADHFMKCPGLRSVVRHARISPEHIHDSEIAGPEREGLTHGNGLFCVVKSKQHKPAWRHRLSRARIRRSRTSDSASP